MALVYLVDTNIISEAEQLRANAAVVSRLQKHQDELALSSVSWHELLYGYHRLPGSKRKQRVRFFIEHTVQPNIPILSYGAVAAEWFAKERARLSKIGRTPSYADGQIAAIAATNNLILVTRNIADFKDFEQLTVENWFDTNY
ncbi:MAG: type II toxin-antitoxin system VapC family toxin [Chloroflexi bacterium]|nr:type II toxin-antitoxin system VapC family toxin [Chloroflexota bacterium]